MGLLFRGLGFKVRFSIGRLHTKSWNFFPLVVVRAWRLCLNLNKGLPILVRESQSQVLAARGPLRMPKWVWPLMNWYRTFFIQTSTVPRKVHCKLTAHGRLLYCKTTNPQSKIMRSEKVICPCRSVQILSSFTTLAPYSKPILNLKLYIWGCQMHGIIWMISYERPQMNMEGVVRRTINSQSKVRLSTKITLFESSSHDWSCVGSPPNTNTEPGKKPTLLWPPVTLFPPQLNGFGYACYLRARFLLLAKFALELNLWVAIPSFATN